MLSPDTTPPFPPIEIDYYNDLYPSTISPEGCAAILRRFGIDDERIGSTRVLVFDNDNTAVVSIPGVASGAIIHPHASESPVIDSDGGGDIIVHMGSVVNAEFSEQAQELVSGQPFAEDKLRSSLFIDGLSQRADLVLMGESALRAEREAAENSIRRRHALKAAAKNIVGGAVIVGMDIAAIQHEIVPTPAGVIVGALGVIAASWWTKTSAETNFYTEYGRHEAFMAWPAQRRARERRDSYLRDADAPLLFLPSSKD